MQNGTVKGLKLQWRNRHCHDAVEMSVLNPAPADDEPLGPGRCAREWWADDDGIVVLCLRGGEVFRDVDVIPGHRIAATARRDNAVRVDQEHRLDLRQLALNAGQELMCIRRRGKRCPLMVDVVKHTREDLLDRFHNCLGVFGKRIRGRRNVVLRPLQLGPIVDPGQPAEQ
jgi:hypothetical protein